MPYEVKKDGDYYVLKKLKDGSIVNKRFKTKKIAIDTAKRYMIFRKEKPIVKGNKILNQNKM